MEYPSAASKLADASAVDKEAKVDGETRRVLEQSAKEMERLADAFCSWWRVAVGPSNGGVECVDRTAEVHAMTMPLRGYVEETWRILRE